MRKLLLKRVPRLLMPDKKKHRFGDSEHCLGVSASSIRRIYWVGMWQSMKHESTTAYLCQKRMSAEWRSVCENRPKGPKTKYQLAELWYPPFGAHMEFCSIANITRDFGSIQKNRLTSKQTESMFMMNEKTGPLLSDVLEKELHHHKNLTNQPMQIFQDLCSDWIFATRAEWVHLKVL